MASLPGFLGLPSLPRAWLSTGLRGTLHAAALPAGVLLQTSDTFCARDLIFPRLPQTVWLAGPRVLPSVPWVGGQLRAFCPAAQVETAVPSGEGARQGHRCCQHDSCPGGGLSVQGTLQHPLQLCALTTWPQTRAGHRHYLTCLGLPAVGARPWLAGQSGRGDSSSCLLQAGLDSS